MADFKIDDTVDITTVVCPTTFVKAKVALEELDDGQILSIKMNDGEPVQNVPRSIKEEGHKILKLIDNEDGTYDLIVQKVGRLMSVRANKDTFESEINEAGKLVIADFYSDSCVPCKRMSPLLAETEEEDPEGIKLVKLNINFDGETAQKYNVTSVPTLVFFKDGAEKARLTGSCKESTAFRNNKFYRLRRNGYDYNSSRQ